MEFSWTLRGDCLFVKESTDCWRRREAKRGEAKRRENSESVSGAQMVIGCRRVGGPGLGTWNLEPGTLARWKGCAVLAGGQGAGWVT